MNISTVLAGQPEGLYAFARDDDNTDLKCIKCEQSARYKTIHWSGTKILHGTGYCLEHKAELKEITA